MPQPLRDRGAADGGASPLRGGLEESRHAQDDVFATPTRRATKPAGIRNGTDPFEKLIDQGTRFAAGGEIDCDMSPKSLVKGLVEALKTLRASAAATTGQRTERDTTHPDTGTILEAIKELRAEVNTLKETRQTVAPTARSYATVAAATAAASTRVANPPDNNKFVVIVHPASPTSLESRTAVIKTNEERKSNDALTAIRLPSGDYKITFKTEEARKKAITIDRWVQAVFGTGATVRRTAITVIAHGFNRSDLADTEALLQELKQDNSPKITGARQPTKQARKDSPKTTLLITVEDVATANLLCERGVCWRYGNYPCFPFAPDAQVTRCYNCHQFGHRARFCRNDAACGWCSAKGHDERECDLKAAKRGAKCVNCQGAHPAWSYECPKAKREAESARDAFFNRPARFRTTHEEQSRLESDGFTMVSPRKRTASQARRSPIEPHRRLGRPPKAALPMAPDNTDSTQPRINAYMAPRAEAAPEAVGTQSEVDTQMTVW